MQPKLGRQKPKHGPKLVEGGHNWPSRSRSNWFPRWSMLAQTWSDVGMMLPCSVQVCPALAQIWSTSGGTRPNSGSNSPSPAQVWPGPREKWPPPRQWAMLPKPTSKTGAAQKTGRTHLATIPNPQCSGRDLDDKYAAPLVEASATSAPRATDTDHHRRPGGRRRPPGAPPPAGCGIGRPSVHLCVQTVFRVRSAGRPVDGRGGRSGAVVL